MSSKNPLIESPTNKRLINTAGILLIVSVFVIIFSGTVMLFNDTGTPSMSTIFAYVLLGGFVVAAIGIVLLAAYIIRVYVMKQS